MPGGDRTGPLGRGPMTGRARGFCAGYDAPGYANYGGGRRMFYGWRGGGGPYGGGRGRGRGYVFREEVFPQVAPETEIESLRAQMSALQTQMDNIMKRLDQLTPPTASE